MEEETVWGIHMGLDHGAKPIENGFISIGWASVGDLSRLSKTREAFKDAVSKAYPNKKPGAIPVDAGTLYRFTNEMKKNDLVVYPSKFDRTVNLGIVDGNYEYAPDLDKQYPHRRRVKWIKKIPRAEFSQSALHEIGAFIALFQVKNNSDEFISALKGDTPLPVESEIDLVQTASAATEIATSDFVTKILKSGLDSYQFEHFIAHLLERMGYHARVTQKSGDGGVDVIAHRDELGFEQPIIKAQCKQTFKNIGQPEVSQLYGHVESSREHGLFITLGNYTSQALQFERSKHNLRLIDGKQLVELIYEHYDKFEPRYQVLLPMKKIYIPAVVSGDDE